MQNSAIEFVQDITNIFGEEIKELYYEKYYISLPVMAYINSAKEIDKSIFNAIYFEDDVRLNEPVKMTTEWNRELGFKNQRPMRELIYGGSYISKKKKHMDIWIIIGIQIWSIIVNQLDWYTIYYMIEKHLKEE